MVVDVVVVVVVVDVIVVVVTGRRHNGQSEVVTLRTSSVVDRCVSYKLQDRRLPE